MPSDGEADRLVGPPMLLGMQLLLLWVLFGMGSYEGIVFGEAADDMGGDFDVGGRLVVFWRNIDPKLLLQVRNIV